MNDFDDNTERKPYESSCVDPCAWLVTFIRHGAIHLSSELSMTLDSYGYMGHDGTAIDVEAADAEFARVARFRTIENERTEQ